MLLCTSLISRSKYNSNNSAAQQWTMWERPGAAAQLPAVLRAAAPLCWAHAAPTGRGGSNTCCSVHCLCVSWWGLSSASRNIWQLHPAPSSVGRPKAGVFCGEEKLQGIGLKCAALGEVNAFPTSKLAPFVISEPEELSWALIVLVRVGERIAPYHHPRYKYRCNMYWSFWNCSCHLMHP